MITKYVCGKVEKRIQIKIFDFKTWIIHLIILNKLKKILNTKIKNNKEGELLSI